MDDIYSFSRTASSLHALTEPKYKHIQCLCVHIFIMLKFEKRLTSNWKKAVSYLAKTKIFVMSTAASIY